MEHQLADSQPQHGNQANQARREGTSTAEATDDPISVLLGRIKDDLTSLGKDELALARMELSAKVKHTTTVVSVILLQALVGAIFLAMICSAIALALEPLIAALWLRLLIMSFVYAGLGYVAVIVVRKLLDAPAEAAGKHG